MWVGFRNFQQYIQRFILGLQSGLSVLQIVNLSIVDESNSLRRESLIQMKKRLERGDNLLQSLIVLLPKGTYYPFQYMTYCPDQLSMLKSLDDYIQGELDRLTTLFKALRYPIVLCGGLLGLLGLGFFLLLPIYVQFLTDMNVTMPAVLAYILQCRTWILRPSILMGMGLLIGGIIWGGFLKTKHFVRKVFFAEHYAQTWWVLGHLLVHGMSLNQSLTILLKGDPYQASLIKAFHQQYLNTASFSKSWACCIRLSEFEKEVLKLAESSGGIGVSMIRLSDAIRVQVYQKRMQRISYISPVLLVCVALLLLLCFYLLTVPMNMILDLL